MAMSRAALCAEPGRDSTIWVMAVSMRVHMASCACGRFSIHRATVMAVWVLRANVSAVSPPV